MSVSGAREHGQSTGVLLPPARKMDMFQAVSANPVFTSTILKNISMVLRISQHTFARENARDALERLRWGDQDEGEGSRG